MLLFYYRLQFIFMRPEKRRADSPLTDRNVTTNNIIITETKINLSGIGWLVWSLEYDKIS